MSDDLNIRSLSVTAAAKLLKVKAKAVREHIRCGLPLVGGKIDLIVYGASPQEHNINEPVPA